MNLSSRQLVSQELLEMLKLEHVEGEFECKKKNCCKKYKKGKNPCKSCPKM